MKFIITVPVLFFIFSCGTARYNASGMEDTYGAADTLITQSLFNDKSASISEENIQRLLDGNYKLPQQLRVAIVRLDNNTSASRRYFWNDEDYLKTQQSYLDSFTAKLRQSPRVQKVSVIPEIVVSKSPSFTQLREAAVRLQSDLVVVYSIASDIYSRYKPFSNPDLKAFATTQLILLDVRTGMVPFSTIVTKDQLSKKTKSELDNAQAAARVQHEAVLLTIDESSRQMLDFLKMN
ncbi:hypothetical protein [Pseudobacter ginsenosidimutans]|uniref:Uncharacterized protein n=1 Tax=Pseudobacter ginsenosidimutans TaxID=661488 RepID=A0A4Q7MC20_9BACT|nr:hypothetical protein [Pseudobacter ginsenosidimutans]QEC45255.1 hypothetical protein FSB84_27500 [Pseudobacter ginsenosidimutans]RZS65524.1 hypothetical protein EV199_5698 [Pseudobacter ginsenosidimutans]